MVVVGDVINDVVVLPLEKTAVGTDTASRVRSLPGGSGANQAAWMAALGASVRFVGGRGPSTPSFTAGSWRRSGSTPASESTRSSRQAPSWCSSLPTGRGRCSPTGAP
ncbi:MAG: PfkB family carbohydrate kinase, partial [Acidimicrobiales bacterium]